MSSTPLHTWEDCRICWEAKGYKMDSLMVELRGVLPPKHGRTKVSKLGNTQQVAPPQVAARVWKLPLAPGASERQYSIYLRGLEAANAAPAEPASETVAPERVAEPTQVQQQEQEALAAALALKLGVVVAQLASKLEELAASAGTGLESAKAEIIQAVSKLTTVKLARRLAKELTAKAAVSAGTGSMLDIFARAIADRLPRVPKLREAKIARHLAKQLAQLNAKLLAWGGAVGGITGGLTACAVLLLFAHCHGSKFTATAPSEPVATNVGQGSASGSFISSMFLRVLQSPELGDRAPTDQYIPEKAASNQKPPPCDMEAGEEAFGGGCYQRVDVKPPCGRKLFRSRTADKCYRPIEAAPQNPMGETARVPGEGVVP